MTNRDWAKRSLSRAIYRTEKTLTQELLDQQEDLFAEYEKQIREECKIKVRRVERPPFTFDEPGE